MAKSDVHVEFFQKDVPDVKASREAGREIRKDVDFIRIRFPGNNKTVVEERADVKSQRCPESGRWLTYAERFPEHYARYREGREYIAGTPLDALATLTAAQRANLRSYNVHTLEQLAAIDGPALKNLGMGARAMKDQAKAYLDSAEGSADVMKYAAENADLKERLEAMEALMAEMRQTEKRGPGRPRKAEEAAA